MRALRPADSRGRPHSVWRIYADDGTGKPGTFAAVTQEVVIAANAPAGWVNFSLLVAAGARPRPLLARLVVRRRNREGVLRLTFPGTERYAPAAYSAGANPPGTFGTRHLRPERVLDLRQLHAERRRAAITGAPTVTGTAVQGETLTADPGTWSGGPSYAYQWRRCDTLGANCANIGGATAQTYDVQAADVGSTLRVRVTASNANGAAVAFSAATAVVQSPSGPAGTFGPTAAGPSIVQRRRAHDLIVSRARTRCRSPRTSAS